MSVSRNTKELISGFGLSCRSRTLVNVLAGGGAAEEKAVPAAGCPVLGLVAGFEQARKIPIDLTSLSFCFWISKHLTRTSRWYILEADHKWISNNLTRR